MQTITYTVNKPEVGQSVKLSVVPDSYTVYQLETTNPVTKVLIRNNTTNALSRLIIADGE